LIVGSKKFWFSKIFLTAFLIASVLYINALPADDTKETAEEKPASLLPAEAPDEDAQDKEPPNAEADKTETSKTETPSVASPQPEAPKEGHKETTEPKGAEEKSQPAASAEEKSQPVASTEEKSQVAAPAESPRSEEAKPEAAKVEAEEKSSEESIKLDPGNVTVNFRGADIRTVLAYISEVAGIDIVAAPDVKGVIDLKLTNKPWKVALDIIVRNYGFAYERGGDIIRVVTLDKLKQEEVITQAFSLNYGKAKDVVNSLKKIVTARGKVKYDERTNMVIVTDIPTNLYKVGQIIEKLDRETEQVLIEARVIETVLGDEEKLGIDWNIKFEVSGAKRPITFPFTYFDEGSQFLEQFSPLVQTGTSTANPAAVGAVVTTTTPGAYPGRPSATNYAKGFPYIDYSVDIFKDTFKFGTLDFSQFQAVLELLKRRSDTNIISNPRIATLNNTEANILVGQTLNMPTYERNSTTGKVEITGYKAKDLGIKLKVTPHINDRNEIVVDLAPEISDLLRYDIIDAVSGIVAPVYSTRQANTKVMLRDGNTIFIGGLIKENIIDTKKPIPIIGDILGDVPYVGLLFSRKEKTKQKIELIFFVTVHLMQKNKEIAGLPTADKTYIPKYELAQEDWQKTVKKRRIK